MAAGEFLVILSVTHHQKLIIKIFFVISLWCLLLLNQTFKESFFNEINSLFISSSVVCIFHWSLGKQKEVIDVKDQKNDEAEDIFYM